MTVFVIGRVAADLPDLARTLRFACRTAFGRLVVMDLAEVEESIWSGRPMEVITPDGKTFALQLGPNGVEAGCLGTSWANVLSELTLTTSATPPGEAGARSGNRQSSVSFSVPEDCRRATDGPFQRIDLLPINPTERLA